MPTFICGRGRCPAPVTPGLGSCAGKPYASVSVAGQRRCPCNRHHGRIATPGCATTTPVAGRATQPLFVVILCLNLVHSRLMCPYFPPMTRFTRRAALFCMASLIELIFVLQNQASTADLNPLRPVDTSSPRATLQDFIASMDQIYLGTKDVLQEYAASQRLYPTPEERRKQVGVLSTAGRAIKVLDLSDIPPVLRDTVAPERAIQLKEILDRIEIPSFESIPDQNQVARTSLKRWRLPGTEIDIVLIETGPARESILCPPTP
jgi:hypothetical protein